MQQPLQNQQPAQTANKAVAYKPISLTDLPRQRAIQLGLLIDVTKFAQAIGFTLPVALSRAAWALSIERGEGDRLTEWNIRCRERRLKEVLWRAKYACWPDMNMPQQLFDVFLRDQWQSSRITLARCEVAGPTPSLIIMLLSELT